MKIHCILIATWIGQICKENKSKTSLNTFFCCKSNNNRMAGLVATFD